MDMDVLQRELRAAIERVWGFRELRPLQGEAMAAMLGGRDSVVVMPTGGGKSLCYQAPGVVLGEQDRTATVVISPLIALMKDQVDSLKAVGVCAASLDSSASKRESDAAIADLRSGELRLLFVSPERLVGSDWLRSTLRNVGVKRFAIDEAHCISAWGHDFRPEYRQLSMLKEWFRGCSVHAFTATATERVRADIMGQLALEDAELLVGNFDRPNLTYRVLPRQDMLGQTVEVIERHKGEAGIIYCLRRKDVDELAAALNRRGLKAMAYHAGMTPGDRHAAQDAFVNEEVDLIVATVAFGMGIDRSSIRFVLHTGMPKSIEAYQQETGRAGRDGLEAECVLLFSQSDVITGLKLIEKSVAEARSQGTEVDDAYVESSKQHIRDMEDFLRRPVCRHQQLVNYFGQDYSPPVDGEEESDVGCGACDVCLGDTQEVADGQVVAQKILSAIARTQERFGAGHVISILRGENLERIRQLGHDQLSVYGLLKDMGKGEVRDYVNQLIAQGAMGQEYVALSNGQQAAILKLNARSWAVMKGQAQAKLIQPIHKSAEQEKERKKSREDWVGVDSELFEAMRALRKSIAEARGLPPYTVFSDATLRELARSRPSTMQKMRMIYGVGEKKLADFGEKFLGVITSHCAAKGLAMDQAVESPKVDLAPKKVSVSPAKVQAFEMFERGASVEDVAGRLNRTVGTVSEYLADFITERRPKSIGAWVPERVYKRVVEATEKHGTGRLRPLFVELEETVPYEVIKLVLAHLRG